MLYCLSVKFEQAYILEILVDIRFWKTEKVIQNIGRRYALIC